MKIERKITIEPERDKDHEPAFSTFPSAASKMPTYSGSELRHGLSVDWRKDTELTFWLAAARIPKDAPAGDDED